MKRLLTPEILRFIAGGLLNTVVSYSLYLLLLLWLPYSLSYSLAYVGGIVFSFFIQTRWVFKVPVSLKKFLAFPLVYLAQYLAGLVLLALLIEWLHIPERWALLIVIALTLPMTFVLSRTILRGKPQKNLD